MKNKIRMTLAFLVLASLAAFTLGGCSNNDEELNRQIQAQIDQIEQQVVGMEKNQQVMRDLIRQMQDQLTKMQQELDKESPRIKSADHSIKYLKQLTTTGFGESPLSGTLREPGWNWTNILWLFFFVLILWLLYRYRVRSRDSG